MDVIDVKYFKLAVGNFKKETAHDIALDCPACDDNKGRLHMYQKDTMEIPLVRCFNAGCDYEEHQGLIKFLSSYAPTIAINYKTEKFKRSIDTLKEGKSLNDIINGTVTSKKPTEIDDIVIETALNFDRHTKEPRVKQDLVKNPRKIPEMFTNMLYYAKDIEVCKEYIQKRNLEVKPDWLFSKQKFVNIFDKAYFVENFIFIPLWQNDKLRGFYTRSIEEKRFSTIIFPKGEKYWVSDNFNPDETCYIFEGIFDAMSSGLDNVVAMLSADLPEEFLDELKEPVFCLDSDKTGVKKSLKYNKQGFKTFIWPEVETKDMNDMLKVQTKEDNKKMILENVYNGLPAQIKLNLNLY